MQNIFSIQENDNFNHFIGGEKIKDVFFNHLERHKNALYSENSVQIIHSGKKCLIYFLKMKETIS